MFKTDTSLSEYDPEISAAIEAERTRQEEHIELIASENHTSPLVMEAQGSVLTTNMPKVIPVSAITAAVSMLMLLKSWLSLG